MIIGRQQNFPQLLFDKHGSCLGPLCACGGHANWQAHLRVPRQELRAPERQNEGALLCGLTFILEVLDLPCNCSISLERTPQVVSLGDKCQIARNSTRSRGGREADSPSCSGDRPSMIPNFPPCPPSVQLPLAFILSQLWLPL